MTDKKAAQALVVFVTLCLFAQAAQAGLVRKTRLDPMNVQYEGLEMNGDDFKDAVLINLVSGEKQFLLGKKGGKYSRIKEEHLSVELKALLPDMVTEVDLNGDRIADLIVVNNGKLCKAASRDDRTFLRVIGYSVYFGEKAGVFKSRRLSTLKEEDRDIILDNAKAALLPPELQGATAGTPEP